MTPVACAVITQVMKKSGNHPTPSMYSEYSVSVFRYEKVARDMSAQILTIKQTIKSILVDACLITKLDIVADST